MDQNGYTLLDSMSNIRFATYLNSGGQINSSVHGISKPEEITFQLKSNTHGIYPIFTLALGSGENIT